MAFQNIVFPKLKLMHETLKTAVNPVVITGNGTREIRRKQNRNERFTWSFPARLMTQADNLATYKFVEQVKGMQDSFLFQCPALPTLTNAPLTHKTGSIWYLNYPNADQSAAGTHPMFNPVMGGLTFKANGVTKSASYSIDSDGLPIVTLSSVTGTESVTVTGVIYYTVRLGGDYSFTIQAMDPGVDSCTPVMTLAGVNDITFVEVYEHA